MAAVTVPEGYRVHSENTTSILIHSDNDAFLNPVQEFNRDLSVACISVWSDTLSAEKAAKSAAKAAKEPPRKKLKLDHTPPADAAPSIIESSNQPRPYRFTMLEPLSATGLRSIRYAKEIPLLKYVVANDLSTSAVEAIQRNVIANGVGFSEDASTNEQASVKVNKGDACDLMYSHRPEGKHVDCIDLDPYGTAAPFIDGAVQAVSSGGLLCVTCTDLAVLATNNFPEKCFANYGGVPAKSEYCHEVALRLVLHMISTAASRYGRIFVRVKVGPAEVKKAFSNTGMVYVCSFCQMPSIQHLGRVVEKASQAGNINLVYRQQQGPPCDSTCPECGSLLHVSGPMWVAPLHDSDFVQRVLSHVESLGPSRYGTYPRMKGMLTLAKEELHEPFYFTPPKLASFFNCVSPPLEEVASALLNAGHEVSRSHCSAGSLKTSASRPVVYEIMRCWIKSHPVVMKNVAEDSPKRRLLAQETRLEADFSRRSNSRLDISTERLVRYQQNPTANWGPGAKAKTGKRQKPSKA